MSPPDPPTRRVPILCSDRGHNGRVPGPHPPVGFIDWPAGQPGAALAAWGYLCDTCTGAYNVRRAAWADTNRGQHSPDWHLLELTDPPRMLDP